MLASALAIGLLSGTAFRGDLRRLRDLSLQWLPLLLVALTARAITPLAGEVALAGYVLAFLAIAAVAAKNRSVMGMPLILVGALLNLAVVALNGGMPVSEDAVRAAAATMPSDRLHLAGTEHAVAALLADTIPLVPFRAVYSIGDVLIALGGGLVAFRAVRE